MIVAKAATAAEIAEAVVEIAAEIAVVAVIVAKAATAANAVIVAKAAVAVIAVAIAAEPAAAAIAAAEPAAVVIAAAEPVAVAIAAEAAAAVIAVEAAAAARADKKQKAKGKVCNTVNPFCLQQMFLFAFALWTLPFASLLTAHLILTFEKSCLVLYLCSPFSGFTKKIEHKTLIDRLLN